MQTTVVYLHGFRSTPQSRKGVVMREAWSDRFAYLAPDLNCSPTQVQPILLETVKGLDPKSLVLVGSSLGGFYANWLAERIGCRAILLNPATEPWTVINDYLGVQPITGTDRTIEVKPEFAWEAQAMVSEASDPSRYFVVLCTGDEVLDWEKAHRKYAACEQLVIEGNTHEIVGFEKCIPALEKFILR